MCQSICTAANVLETQEKLTEVTFSLADLRPRVVDKLRSSYYPAVKEFCRGRRFRPSNDPYFKLLHAVGQQDSSIVDLNEMANALTGVRGSINNIKEHRLEVLINSKPAVAERFYYNTETKSFAIEDPALFTSSSTSIGIGFARTAASDRPRSITSGTLLSHSQGRTGSLPSILTIS